jgi:hypothetical protein
MNAAEVKEGHVEVHGGFKMVNGFAESEAQARKAAQMRAHAQVGAFDVLILASSGSPLITTGMVAVTLDG